MVQTFWCKSPCYSLPKKLSFARNPLTKKISPGILCRMLFILSPPILNHTTNPNHEQIAWTHDKKKNKHIFHESLQNTGCQRISQHFIVKMFSSKWRIFITQAPGPHVTGIHLVGKQGVNQTWRPNKSKPLQSVTWATFKTLLTFHWILIG